MKEIPYYINGTRAEVFNENVSKRIRKKLARRYFNGKTDGIIISAILFYNDSEEFYAKTNKGRFALDSSIFL